LDLFFVLTRVWGRIFAIEGGEILKEWQEERNALVLKEAQVQANNE